MDLADVGHRGFAYVPSFLDRGEVELLRGDFDSVSVEANANYHVRRVSPSVLQQLNDKCQAVAQSVHSGAGIRTNMVNDAVYFATFTERSTIASPKGGRQQFSWHQDHENYWQWQDSWNYLNLYIPIVKPEHQRSNLGVVPFDRLRQRAPDLYEKLVGRGATRVLRRRHGWVIKDDDRGGNVARIDFDLAELEQTPQLSEGDLLLMRGDVIHRTQDASTRRIAVSIRMSDADAIVERSKLARGGMVKAVMMISAASLFEPYFHYFDATRSDTATGADLHRHVQKLKQQRRDGQRAAFSTTRTAFLGRLLREKIRAIRPRARAGSRTPGYGSV